MFHLVYGVAYVLRPCVSFCHSCYQDLAWVTLQTLSPLTESESAEHVPIDPAQFRTNMLATFGPNTEHARMREWIAENKYWDTPWQERAPLKGPYEQVESLGPRVRAYLA